MQALHPSIKTVWRIGIAIWTSILTIGLFIYEIVQLIGGADRTFPFGVLTGIVLLAAVLLIIFLPPLRYRFWRYELREDELHLKRGILTRVYTIVPLRRIQHLDVSQNIFEREFDLARLIIHTAGTQGNIVELPGLQLETANGLRDRLKQYILEDTL